MIRLSTLIEGLDFSVLGAPLSHHADRYISDIATRFEHAHENALFVCTRTVLRNGHPAAFSAYAAGCRVFVAERGLGLPPDATVLIVEESAEVLARLAARCYGDATRRLTVFGITGTAGKTSVVLRLAHILARAGHRVATLTDEGTAFEGLRTPQDAIVPDAAELGRRLAYFAHAGAEIVLLELSAYQLAQKSALYIPFTAVLLTNLDPDHRTEGYFRSPEAYRAAKESLLAGKAAFAVMPTACADLACAGKRICFGEGGDFSAACIRTDDDLVTHFTLCEGEMRTEIALRAIGTDAVENALAAAVLARIAGCTHGQIADALCDPIEIGRLECVVRSRGRTVFVDAGYTAEHVAHALTVLRAVTRGRLSVVVGSVGGRAQARRAPLARAALEHADFVYFTADNPDREPPEAVCAALLEAAPDKRRLVILPDREQAIRRAVSEMRPDDVLLLAGKGNEDYQLICGKRVPFCERAIAKSAMAHA